MLSTTRPYGLSSTHRMASDRAGAPACRLHRAVDCAPARPGRATTARRKQLPPPGLLATVRSPPIASAMRLTKAKPEPRAAEAARDVLVRLGERPKQLLDLRGREPDAAVGHRERRAASCPAPRFRAVTSRSHTPALGEFHRVVDQVLDRRAQPQRIADHRLRQVLHDVGLDLEPLGPGTRAPARPRARRPAGAGGPARGAAPGPCCRHARHPRSAAVSIARCSAVLLIAFAQPRSRSPSCELANSSLNARMPVSGVRISCARSASVASMVRAVVLASDASAQAAWRAGARLPAEVLDLRHRTLRTDRRQRRRTGRQPEAQANPTILRMSAAAVPCSRRAAQRSRASRFRQLPAVGIENQPVVMVHRCREPEQCLQQAVDTGRPRTGPARAPPA